MSEAKIDIEAFLDDVISRITLTEDALELSSERWSKLRDMCQKSDFGFPSDTSKKEVKRKKEDAFLGALRLMDECNSIQSSLKLEMNEMGILSDAAPESIQSMSVVIDAVAFTEYAEVDRDPEYVLRGFHFLRSKISQFEKMNLDDLDHQLERNYFVALYSELFKLNRTISITESGRTELANAPGNFLRSGDPNSKYEYQLERIRAADQNAALIAEQVDGALIRTSTIAQLLRLGTEDRVKHTREAFLNIVNSVSIPSAYNKYVLARFNFGLKMAKNNLSLAVTGVSRDLREKFGSDVSADFDYVLRCLNQERKPELNAARRSLEKAFQTFQSEFFGNSSAELSYGAIQNMGSLFEIHMINCVLDKMGIDHEARYFHKNLTVFGFLRGFPRGRVAVPSAHPRFALFYARPEMLNHEIKLDKNSTFSPSRALQIASMAVSSFEARLLYDGQISLAEYDSFSNSIQVALEQIQEMHVSLLIEGGNFEEDEESRREQASVARQGLEIYFENSLSKAIELNEGKGMDPNASLDAEIDRINLCLASLKKLETQLEMAFLTTRATMIEVVSDKKLYVKNDLYDQTSQSQMDHFLSSLNAVSRQDTQTKNSTIMVSFFGGEHNKGPKRVNCIPLSGHYRYLFTIHNPLLALHAQKSVEPGSNLIAVHSFCDAITQACDTRLKAKMTSSKERFELLAQKQFVSAFQSASLGNWGLAQSLVENALAYVGEIEVKHCGRIEAFQFELYSFKQYTLRALSEETHSRKLKNSYIRGAISSLSLAGNHLVAAGKNYFAVQTPFVPQSVRLCIARISAELEWDINISRGYLAKGSTLDWSSLPTAEYGLMPNYSEYAEKLFDGNYKDYPISQKYEEMQAICTTLLRQILEVIKSIRQGRYASHSLSMWRYIALRTAQTSDFANLTRFILEGKLEGFLEPRFYSHHQFPELIDILSEYRLDNSKAGLNGRVLSENKGLMAATEYYFRVCTELKESSGVPNQSKGSAFSKLESACSGLVQTGIPRYVVNELKEGVRNEILMRAQALLDRDGTGTHGVKREFK